MAYSRAEVLRVSFEDLAERLGLPESDWIAAVCPPTAESIARGEIELVVSGPDRHRPGRGGPVSRTILSDV